MTSSDPLLRQLAEIANNKVSLIDFCVQNNIPHPKVYGVYNTLGSIPFNSLPKSCVIKPSDNWCANGVLPMHNGMDLLRHTPIPYLPTYYRKLQKEFKYGGVTTGDTQYIVEELLFDYDPAFPLIRGFKVYVDAQRKPFVIQVESHNNAPCETSVYHLPSWSKYEHEFKNWECPTAFETDAPPLLPQLFDLVNKLSSLVPVFCRFDCYLTKDKVYLGEITPSPGDGKNYRKHSRKFLLKHT